MENIVDSPEALSKLASENNLENAHMRLKLLQPLTYKSVFEANRAPESRFMSCHSSHSENKYYHVPSKNEYISHATLSKEWRQVWSTFPTVIDRVTFDLSLDCQPGEDRIAWKDNMTFNDGTYDVSFDTAGINLLMCTMGNVMHIRSKGRVKMDVASGPCSHDARFEAAINVVEGAFEALRTGGKSEQNRRAKSAAKKAAETDQP